MGDKKIAPANNATSADNATNQKVVAMKDEGNQAYKNGDTEAAIIAYTKGNNY